MGSYLADHIRRERLGRKLTLGQLAQLVGYRNISNRVHCMVNEWRQWLWLIQTKYAKR